MQDWLTLDRRPTLVFGAGGLGGSERAEPGRPRCPCRSRRHEPGEPRRGGASREGGRQRGQATGRRPADGGGLPGGRQRGRRAGGNAAGLPARCRPQRAQAGPRAGGRRLAGDSQPEPVVGVLARPGRRAADGRGAVRPDGLRVVGFRIARPPAPRPVRGDQGRDEPIAPGHGARVGPARCHGQRRRARLHRDRPDQGLPRQRTTTGRAWNRSSRRSGSAVPRRWPTRSRSSRRTAPASSPVRSCTSTAAASWSDRHIQHIHPGRTRRASRTRSPTAPLRGPVGCRHRRRHRLRRRDRGTRRPGGRPRRRRPLPQLRGGGQADSRPGSGGGQHSRAAPGRHRRLGADQGDGRRRLRAAGRRRRPGQQRRRRRPRADVVARHHRGVDRPRPGRRHQGHAAVRARVRRADAGARATAPS